MSLGSRGSPRRGRGDRSGTPETLGVVLDGLFRQAPWEPGMLLGELGRRWIEVVGEPLSAECTPVALQGAVLLVSASSAPWAAQLRFLHREIASRANDVLGADKVRDVRVVVAP